MKIIPYEERFRDDMIFMILEAKDALGSIPRLNGDLLDIRGNYIIKGDMFWLAVEEDGEGRERDRLRRSGRRGDRLDGIPGVR